jgi:repressor LexA
MTIGERIRTLRLKKGISPEKLGLLSDVSGQYIRKLELGFRKSITIATAQKLAKGLDIPVSDLLDDTGESQVLAPKSLKEVLEEARLALDRLDITEVPLRGTVPAGYADIVENESGEYIEIPRQELDSKSPGKLYALKISGDSLAGDDIYADDIVIIEPTSEVIDGRIYIVRLENQCVARHVYKLDSLIKLVSSNGEYKEIQATDVEILGRVILSGRWKKH